MPLTRIWVIWTQARSYVLKVSMCFQILARSMKVDEFCSHTASIVIYRSQQLHSKRVHNLCWHSAGDDHKQQGRLIQVDVPALFCVEHFVPRRSGPYTWIYSKVSASSPLLLLLNLICLSYERCILYTKHSFHWKNPSACWFLTMLWFCMLRPQAKVFIVSFGSF